MFTITKKGNHHIVEFDSEFDSAEIMGLMHQEAYFEDEPVKSTIWHIGKHTSRLHLGELLTIVDVAAQLPLEYVQGKTTAIVTDHSTTRFTLQMLADGLQNKLPMRCRTFKTIEEAQRWLDYVGSI